MHVLHVRLECGSLSITNTSVTSGKWVRCSKRFARASEDKFINLTSKNADTFIYCIYNFHNCQFILENSNTSHNVHPENNVGVEGGRVVFVFFKKRVVRTSREK